MSSSVDMDWKSAICAVCIEPPHNVILLLSPSHEKGCRPYMCDTSYQHSNCLTPAIYGESKASDLPCPQCPLCRSPVKGWTVVRAASVRRVPEVVEFNHSLMKRDTKRDSVSGVGDAPSVANARNMIREIEHRSAHLLAIKTGVETQGDFMRFLIKEVENAAFSNIKDLVSFVKWLDDELSFLVDERAVMKHFDWPEAKSDAMREAAFGYYDLRKLELEAFSFCDDLRQPCASAIKTMQSLLEKLEHGIYSLSRVREGAMERYKNFQIPWNWMLVSGIVSQIKLASVKLAMKYMKKVTSEISAIAGGPEEKDLMLQGVRFAFRVYQFAGGFDMEIIRAIAAVTAILSASGGFYTLEPDLLLWLSFSPSCLLS